MSKNGGHGKSGGRVPQWSNKVPSGALTRSPFQALGPEMVLLPLVQRRRARPRETRCWHTARTGRLVTHRDPKPAQRPAHPTPPPQRGACMEQAETKRPVQRRRKYDSKTPKSSR